MYLLFLWCLIILVCRACFVLGLTNLQNVEWFQPSSSASGSSRTRAVVLCVFEKAVPLAVVPACVSHHRAHALFANGKAITSLCATITVGKLATTMPVLVPWLVRGLMCRRRINTEAEVALREILLVVPHSMVSGIR